MQPAERAAPPGRPSGQAAVAAAAAAAPEGRGSPCAVGRQPCSCCTALLLHQPLRPSLLQQCQASAPCINTHLATRHRCHARQSADGSPPPSSHHALPQGLPGVPAGPHCSLQPVFPFVSLAACHHINPVQPDRLHDTPSSPPCPLPVPLLKCSPLAPPASHLHTFPHRGRGVRCRDGRVESAVGSRGA